MPNGDCAVSQSSVVRESVAGTFEQFIRRGGQLRRFLVRSAEFILQRRLALARQRNKFRVPRRFLVQKWRVGLF